MSNLGKRMIIGKQWVDAASPVLDGFLNCKFVLLDMHLNEDGADYNWRTNQGGTAEPTVLFNGVGQVQVYRFTLTMDAPVGSVDQVRNARFTVDADDFGMVNVRKGQRIMVTECELNPSLTTYQYVVNSGLNSGTPLRRTIETEIDMARVMAELPTPVPFPSPGVFPGG